MFKKILQYGLPAYLYGLEHLLKMFAHIQSDSIAGPTLAGAALGFLLPLTELKVPPVDPALLKQLQRAKTKVYLVKDKTFSDLVWVTFFVALGCWMVCIYLTLQPVHQSNGFLNLSFLIGGIIFVISIVLSEAKERI